MNKGKYVYAQLMSLIHPEEFDRCVTKYCGHYRVRTFSCCHQFLCLSFGQLTHRESLRDQVICLQAHQARQSAKMQVEMLRQIAGNVEAIHSGLKKLQEAYEKAHHAGSLRQEADIFCHQVKPQMDTIREAVDSLEAIVDDQYWPLVKYRELLFVR